MQLERNGIDLALDYGKVSVIDKVEAANKRYQQNHRQPPASSTTTAAILHQVQEIFVPINEIYADIHGPNICDRIFDMNDLDYNDVMDVYLAIISGIGEAREEQTAKRLESARKNNERLQRIKQMQDELYTAMVIAMKRDLYGTKGSASLPVELGLTTFTIN